MIALLSPDRGGGLTQHPSQHQVSSGSPPTPQTNLHLCGSQHSCWNPAVPPSSTGCNPTTWRTETKWTGLRTAQAEAVVTVCSRGHTQSSSSPYTNNPQQTTSGCREIHSEQAHQHQPLTSQQAHWSLLPNHSRTLFSGRTLSGINIMVRYFGEPQIFPVCVELPLPCWFKIHDHIPRKCLSKQGANG